MPDDDVVLTVRLPADLLRHARSVASSRDETISQVVRRLLRQYVAAGPRQLELEDMVRQQPATKPAKGKTTTKPVKPKAAPRRR